MSDYKLLLIVGQTGMGKTSFVKELLKNKIYVVLDPAGAWYGIKEIQNLNELKGYRKDKSIRITTLLYKNEVEVVSTIQNFKKINLVIDDADTFIFYRNKIIYNPFFYAYRHLQQNVFVICHSFDDVPRPVLRTADFFVVFPHISKILNIPSGEKFNPKIYKREDISRYL
ncbi:MAG: hypothetical protein ABIL89_03085 [candidate division WOR-3 bacterium]